MEIDPILFLSPLLSLGITLGVTLYWWRRHGFRAVIIPLTLFAYFIAIALKVVVQSFTAVQAEKAFGPISVGFGLYLGLQTVFFEVGLAYVFALVGARKFMFEKKDAVPYGLGLAFWENGVLLGIYPLLQLILISYSILGNSSAAATTYFHIATSNPSYFYPPAKLLPSILYGALERTSSLLAHTAWGMLVVIAAVTRRKIFLAIALPMGLVDALVPFASLTSIAVFEIGIFLLGVGFILVAIIAMRSNKEPITTQNA